MKKRLRFISFILCFITAVTLLCGCVSGEKEKDKDQPEDPPAKEDPAPQIEQTQILLTVGEFSELTVDLSGVLWGSEDESIATVDQSGRVTAVRMGQTNVYAEKNGKKGYCLISIAAQRVTVEKTVKLYLSRLDEETNKIDFSDDGIIKDGLDYKLYDVTSSATELTTVRKGNTFSISRNGLIAGERRLALLEDGKLFYEFNATVVSKVIRTAEELINYKDYGTTINRGYWDDTSDVKYILNGYFELGANIDLSGQTQVINCDIFHQITASKYGEDPFSFGFAGTFDGMGYTVNGGIYGHGGLFGRVASSGIIKNVAFTNATVKNADGKYEYCSVLSAIFSGRLENTCVEITQVRRLATWGVATGVAEIIYNGSLKNFVAYYPNENQDGYFSYSHYIRGTAVSAENCYSVSGGFFSKEINSCGYAYLGGVSQAVKDQIKAYSLTDTDLVFTGLDVTENGLWAFVGERIYFKSSAEYLG